MRSRAALADESDESRCATVGRQARTTSAPATTTATPIQITRFLRSTFGAMRTSWAEVSRIIVRWRSARPRGRVRGISIATSRAILINDLIYEIIFRRFLRTDTVRTAAAGQAPDNVTRRPVRRPGAWTLVRARPTARMLCDLLRPPASLESSERSQLSDRCARSSSWRVRVAAMRVRSRRSTALSSGRRTRSRCASSATPTARARSCTTRCCG